MGDKKFNILLRDNIRELVRKRGLECTEEFLDALNELAHKRFEELIGSDVYNKLMEGCENDR